MSDDLTQNKLLWPVLASLAGAAVLLVFWILPAEYGVDPTGFGKLTGLAALAAEEEHAFEEASTRPHAETQSFELLGFESFEFKFDMAEHSGMVFNWTASAPLHHDMHAEPDGAEEGFAVSYDAGEAARRDGTYIAEFDGEHGWYWENRSAEPIRLKLTATGFFRATALYRDGNVMRQSLPEE